MAESEVAIARKQHEVPFEQLPNYRQVWNQPPGSYAEGLGRMVIVTPEIVAEAARECIKSGKRTTVSWNMEQLNIANFNRQPTQHHIISLLGGIAFDDVYIFNPQQSSQWDGLRHFSAPFPTESDPSKRLYYGGVEAKDIGNKSNKRIGLQHWAKEGICGRGVLLDYKRYADKHGIAYSCFSDHSISLSVLKEIAKEANITFKRGDILFIRMGLIPEWEDTMTAQQKADYASTSSPKHAGVQGTMEMVKWLWDNGISAVAGDAVSWEVYPPLKEYDDGAGGKIPSVFMHEILLAGWGMPIGELFDLEALSTLCEKQNQWSFFVSSAPLNMPGGRWQLFIQNKSEP